MQHLWLSEEQARTIANHAKQNAPREACGLIGGSEGRAASIVPVPNVADDPEHYYRAADRDLVQAVMSFRQAGQSLIGIYHSHPHSDPIPSKSDIALANYPDAAYLIVGLRGREAAFAAWTIRYGVVERLPLYIGPRPPEVLDSEDLSRAQKIAILLGALIAFTIMIVISLSLLPPAPEIPVPR